MRERIELAGFQGLTIKVRPIVEGEWPDEMEALQRTADGLVGSLFSDQVDELMAGLELATQAAPDGSRPPRPARPHRGGKIVLSYYFYALGSLCFLIGTLIALAEHYRP